MRTDSGLFKFSVFSRLPLGGRLLAKQGGEGCRYPHPGKQSDEQLQHLLSPLGRVASNREPREVCLNSPSFCGFPLGGGSLRSKVVRGAVIYNTASRAAQSAGNGLFQFSVFSRLPLGGRLLAKQGGEGCRYLQHGKQSGERMRTDRGLLKTYPPPPCLQKIHFFKPFKMQKQYLQ